MTTCKRTLALTAAVCGVVLATLVSGTDATGADRSKPLVEHESSQTAVESSGASKINVTPADVLNSGASQISESTTPKASDPASPNVANAAPAAPVETEGPIISLPKDETPAQVQILDECIVLEICVDHYLWELYQRAAKIDTSKVNEWRKVKVRKRGKVVTVKQRFTKLVTEDFAWKDPHSAEKAGMLLMDYVIGGMDRDFKLKLFQALRAAELEGLAPGITSGFRDDYRQSIASGLKAASNRSYHGGSLRGGYGHGLAADVVSTKGATRAQRWVSTDALWKWIDANEQQFGVGRPYLSKDPPHVTPIDGDEYTSRRGTKIQVAGADAQKAKQVTTRHAHAGVKARQRHAARVKGSARHAKKASYSRAKLASAVKRN